MKTNIKPRILALTIFSVAMGMLEAAVVIYLRKLFYDSGFDFPINPIEDHTIALTEILREAATLVMLIGIGYLYGRDFITRFAAFLYSFAIWDIFYYVFLKLILGWPESLFTWDVLFLIPVTWVGPVLAPVLVSFTMILYAFVFIKASEISENTKPDTKSWLTILMFAGVILISFTMDPLFYIIQHHGLESIFYIQSDRLFVLISNYIPSSFNWWVFGIGELGLFYGILRYWKKLKIGQEYNKVVINT